MWPKHIIFADRKVIVRYLRWYPLARPNDISTVSIGDITVAATIGGPDLCAGKSYSASVGTAANAFNNNPDTGWTLSKDDYMDQWIQCDFGTIINPVECTFRTMTAGQDQTPTVWLMRGSIDGTNWSSICVFEFTAFTIAQTKIAIVTQQDMSITEANARGWEVLYTAQASTELWIREIEFRPIYNGAAIALQSGYAYTSKANAGAGTGGLARNLFDGSTATYTSSQNASLVPLRHGFMRAAPVGAMQEMLINPEGGTMPTALSARWTVDGFTWYVKKPFSSFTLTNGVWTSFDLR